MMTDNKHEREPASSPSTAAEEDFSRRMRIHRSLYGNNIFEAESADNVYLGQNILREEIGYFADKLKSLEPYDFDQTTRDRLIAHGRQDTASAYAHAHSAFKYAFRASVYSRRTLYIGVLALLIATVNSFMLYHIAYGSD